MQFKSVAIGIQGWLYYIVLKCNCIGNQAGQNIQLKILLQYIVMMVLILKALGNMTYLIRGYMQPANNKQL
jgi:hypothetical protein